VIKIEFYLIVHGAGALITSELELLDRYYSILRRRLDYILSSALTRTHHHLVVGQLFIKFDKLLRIVLDRFSTFLLYPSLFLGQHPITRMP
jgi:hypothetical protein